MKNCPSCKKPISPKAETCPACGHPIKKKTTGCALAFLIGLIFIILLAAIGSNTDAEKQPVTSKAKTEVAAKIYTEGETVSIGYTTYVAWQSYWTDKLSDNPHRQTAPNAKYLVIEVSVRNDDNKERSIPPFKLIDSDGREYGTSSSSWQLTDHIGTLASLNPDVQKGGWIVFDCPPERAYKLKVSGGFWSSDDALIQLDPK